jgi:translation initiation factor IF-2
MYIFAMKKEIGKVTHWYDHVGVAVLKLTGSLKVGDRIIVRRGDDEFEDTVSSMQVDHKEVDIVGKKDNVAIKLSQKAKPGAGIYLAE